MDGITVRLNAAGIVVCIFAPVLMIGLQAVLISQHRQTARERAPRIGIEAVCARIANDGPRKGRQLDSHVIEVDGKYLCLVGDPRGSRYEIAAVIDQGNVVAEDKK